MENTKKGVLNPLDLDHILQKILRHLPRSSLETAACVNKTWRAEVGRAFKTRCSAAILGRWVNAADTLQDIRNDLSRFHVVYLEFVDLGQLVQPFMEMIAELSPYLDTISMEECRCTAEDYQRIMGFIATHASYLEKLILGPLGVLRDDDYNYNSYFPIYDSTTNALMGFPSLKELNYTSMASTPTYLSHVIQACPNLISLTIIGLNEEPPIAFASLQLPKLKNLNLVWLHKDHYYWTTNRPPPPVGLSSTHIKCLMELKLSLRRLSITNIYGSTSTQLIQDWLNSMSSSLIGLTLTAANTSIIKMNHPVGFTKSSPDLPPQPKLFPFPTPLNLREATVWKPFIKNLGQLLKSCPNLKELILPFHPGTNWAGILPNVLPIHTGIKLLQLHWIPSNILSKLLPKTFPNLTSLSLADCTSTDLLSVVFSSCGDSLKWLTLESDYTKESSIRDEILNGQRKGDPYIGQLKKLKGLCLNNGQWITGSSIRSGLIDCPELCFLAIKNNKISQDFIQDCFSIGLVQTPTIARMDICGCKCETTDYGYNYFIKSATTSKEKNFEKDDDETLGVAAAEFIEAVSKIDDGWIRKLYLDDDDDDEESEVIV